MTRFQIVGIFEDKILESCQFNGSGYFERMGKEVCGSFSKIKSEEEYRQLIKNINDNSYEYNDVELVYETEETIEYGKFLIDVFNFFDLETKKLYGEMWNSNYLYIKNFSSDNYEIISKDGIKINIKPGGWATLHYGAFYKKKDYTK